MNPGAIWHSVPYGHGRASIFKALHIDPREPSAGFACACFRIVADDGVNYIAGAVGCPPHLDLERFQEWTPDNVSEVILWNPRTAELRVLGEAKSQTILIAPRHAEIITVFKDGYAFFRAWAERRAEFAARKQGVLNNAWVHPMPETSDSLIPGALIVGDTMAVKGWGALSQATLIPGPGVSEDELKKSVWRASDIPSVKTRAAQPARKVAA